MREHKAEYRRLAKAAGEAYGEWARTEAGREPGTASRALDEALARLATHEAKHPTWTPAEFR